MLSSFPDLQYLTCSCLEYSIIPVSETLSGVILIYSV